MGLELDGVMRTPLTASVAFLGLLSACGRLGVNELARADWFLGVQFNAIELGVSEVEGCPRVDDRLRVTWNGSPLEALLVGGQYRTPRGEDCMDMGCPPYDVCVGYLWRASPASPGLAESDVVEMTDGVATLRAESRRQVGSFAWVSPPGGVVDASTASVEFTLGLTPAKDPRNSFLGFFCEGNWWRAGKYFDLTGESPDLASGRYRLNLRSPEGVPPGPGVIHCRVSAGEQGAMEVCPAKRCLLQRSNPVLDAAGPTQLAFDITVR